MSAEGASFFDEMVREAEEKVPEVQPWQDYFKLRAREVETLLWYWSPSPGDTLLEIGCGNGFNALLLSKRCSKIVATDLEFRDPSSHTIGMDKARHLLIDAFGANNVRLLSCTGERLPFKDNSFEKVVILYTLEHIADRNRTLEEIKRVLKTGGETMIMVPSVAWSIFQPIQFHKYLLGRIVSRFSRFLKIKKEAPASNHDLLSVESDQGAFFDRFRRNYPYFPLPNPHGIYRNFLDETMHYLYSRWVALVEASGLKVKRTFTTMIYPKNMLSILSGRLSFQLYMKSLWINKRLGANSLLKKLGENLCLVAVKD